MTLLASRRRKSYAMLRGETERHVQQINFTKAKLPRDEKLSMCSLMRA